MSLRLRLNSCDNDGDDKPDHDLEIIWKECGSVLPAAHAAFDLRDRDEAARTEMPEQQADRCLANQLRGFAAVLLYV